MDTARLILEFLKVLIWPAVILAIVLIFKSHLEQILRQFSDRLGTAENLKFGLMGQEVNISGTAKVLEKERAFLAQSSDPQVSQSKLQAIDRAARQLSDPIVDVIMLTLLRTKGVARVDKIVQAVIDARFDKTQFLSPVLISGLKDSVERALATLQALEYVDAKDNEYELTDAGRLVFQRVAEHESEVIARYKYDI